MSTNDLAFRMWKETQEDGSVPQSQEEAERERQALARVNMGRPPEVKKLKRLIDLFGACDE